MVEESEFFVWFHFWIPPSYSFSPFSISIHHWQIQSESFLFKSWLLLSVEWILHFKDYNPAPAHLASHSVFVFVFFVFVFSKITTQHRLTTSASHSMQCLHLFEKIFRGEISVDFVQISRNLLRQMVYWGDMLKIKRPTCSKSYQVQYKTNTEPYISR